eukprot:gene5829-8038_t
MNVNKIDDNSELKEVSFMDTTEHRYHKNKFLTKNSTAVVVKVTSNYSQIHEICCSKEVLKIRSIYFYQLFLCSDQNEVESESIITIVEDKPLVAIQLLKHLHDFNNGTAMTNWNLDWAMLSVKWQLEDLIEQCARIAYFKYKQIVTNIPTSFVLCKNAMINTLSKWGDPSIDKYAVCEGYFVERFSCFNGICRECCSKGFQYKKITCKSCGYLTRILRSMKIPRKCDKCLAMDQYVQVDYSSTSRQTYRQNISIGDNVSEALFVESATANIAEGCEIKLFWEVIEFLQVHLPATFVKSPLPKAELLEGLKIRKDLWRKAMLNLLDVDELGVVMF